MARLFASTDFIRVPQTFSTGGCFSFWMRTTQTTTNAEIVGHHNAGGSANGWGLFMNPAGAPGKLAMYGKAGLTIVFNMNGTSTVNDGQWHHIGINLWYNVKANGNQFYVDGVLQGAANAGALWGGATDDFYLGRSNDAFWAGYVGELAEMAVWAGGGQTLELTTDQIASLRKGFAADTVWRGGSAGGFHIYMPLVRSAQCEIDEGTPVVTGTSVTDHPRMIASRGP